MPLYPHSILKKKPSAGLPAAAGDRAPLPTRRAERSSEDRARPSQEGSSNQADNYGMPGEDKLNPYTPFRYYPMKISLFTVRPKRAHSISLVGALLEIARQHF